MMKTSLAKSAIDALLSIVAFRLKALLGIKTTCVFGPFSIVLPSTHLLPKYQREHRLYDKFLPFLGRALPANSTVIDVGANCGDTLAAMLAANQTLKFACIEPDDTFYRYLQENIARIQSVAPQVGIQAIKALVGKSVTQAALQGSKGTAKAILGSGEHSQSSRTLDAIALEFSLANVNLLKSDVDGFDYDVIDSAEQVLRAQEPIVFFECYFDHLAQRESLKRSLRLLQSANYSQWFVFDNFGELVLRTQDLSQLDQLLDYCGRQNMGRSTRTIYYFDFLAATNKHTALVESVVSSYVEQLP
jgi:FkbM family methyltransferase